MKTIIKIEDKIILKKISTYFKLNPKDIIGKSKKREIADARFIFYKILKDKGYTHSKIGCIVGNRAHSTITNGLKKLDEIPIITENYKTIKKKLNEYFKSKKITI